MRLPEHFRSTSFRLGSIYGALFLVSMMAILGITYLAATAEVEGIVRLSVVEDMKRFQAAAAQSGDAGLLAAVRARSDAATDDHFYLLTDLSGVPVAGNLPAEVWREGWSERKLRGSVMETSEALRAAAAMNSDNEVRLFSQGVTIGGYRVLVARNSHILDETQEIILGALLWGCGVTMLLALVGGLVIGIGPTRRVDAIAAAMRSVAAGRFDQRLPDFGRKDELGRLSSDINVMLSRIEILMSSLKQVSTDIAHDLRTPLARLRQGLEGTQRRGDDAAALRTAVDAAVGEVDSIIETFNALLRIAQIEAGARKAKFRPLDLSALLFQMHDVFESVAEESGKRLELAADEGLRVQGDRDLLQQLFSNLVDNALTHVPAPARIVLSARAEGERIIVDVADDGPGVPEAEREKIFRRLYRLDRSRTTPGNGLGLALVAAIAELHDARITALDNCPGLRMRIDFPASREN
jgi:signal transduction histidine kinase